MWKLGVDIFIAWLSSRLVEDDERKWTEENINNIALKHFPNIDRNTALARPILYSNWLSKDYMPVEQEELRDFVKARLKVKITWVCRKLDTREENASSVELSANWVWIKGRPVYNQYVGRQTNINRSRGGKFSVNCWQCSNTYRAVFHSCFFKMHWDVWRIERKDLSS